MAITFITGNAGKFSEAKGVLLGVELVQREMDLPEIQEVDRHEIIRHKLHAVGSKVQGACMVEDTSLHFDCLGGDLPGPLIKWFRQALGVEGLVELVERYQNPHVTASVLVGYRDEAGAIFFFEGSQRGTLVRPRGDNDFDWGPAFLPEGHEKTFGEMTREEKHAISMRGMAFKKLAAHLGL